MFKRYFRELFPQINKFEKCCIFSEYNNPCKLQPCGAGEICERLPGNMFHCRCQQTPHCDVWVVTRDILQVPADLPLIFMSGYQETPSTAGASRPLLWCVSSCQGNTVNCRCQQYPCCDMWVLPGDTFHCRCQQTAHCSMSGCQETPSKDGTHSMLWKSKWISLELHHILW